MKQSEIKGLYENWEDVKRRLLRKHPELDERDLTFKKGEEEKLIDRVQQKLGESREEIIKLLKQGQQELPGPKYKAKDSENPTTVREESLDRK